MTLDRARDSRLHIVCGVAILLVLAGTCSFSTGCGSPDGQVFNVTSFGANGEDSTDDWAALMKAFAAAAAVSGDIYLPSGTYYVSRSSGIALPDNVDLYGDGIYKPPDRSGTWLKGRLSFGSNAYVHDLKIGNTGNCALTNRRGATHTTFENVRFRGGPLPVIYLGNVDPTVDNSCSYITFRDSEVERNWGVQSNLAPPFKGYGEVNIWPSGDRGKTQIHHISFDTVHFGVKNGHTGTTAGKNGVLYANDWGSGEFSVLIQQHVSGGRADNVKQMYHDISFTECIFEPSWIFNLDLTDWARAWADAHGVERDWTKIPDVVHAKKITIVRSIIKGGGRSGTWAYGICFENPIHWTVEDTTIYDGNGTGLDEPHASWECGGGRILNGSGSLVGYLEHSTPDTLNVWRNNRVLPGFGSYTPSPYDP